MTCPKNCNNRNAYCHTYCEKFINAAPEREELKQKRREYWRKEATLTIRANPWKGRCYSS